MINYRFFNKVFLSFFLFIFAFSFLCVPFFTVAEAAGETMYSNVIDDLSIDKNFDIKDYPSKTNDTSVYVINIAESSNGELFLYCYIPYTSKDGLEATSVNISTSFDNPRYNNYKLRLLSNSGTLSKYLVEVFKVKSDTERYYDIPSVYRKYYQDIDGAPIGNNVVSETACSVGKRFTAYTLNDTVIYTCTEIEVVYITDKFVGFCRYSDGLNLFRTACDSHFVAFNTDKPIDRLLEADVYFKSQDYVYNSGILGSERYGDIIENVANLEYTQKGSNNGLGLFAPSYTWDRIESVEQFIAENEGTQNVYSGAIFNVQRAQSLTEEAKSELSKMQWVLRFTETDYLFSLSSTPVTVQECVIVSDVSILRLKFETDGVVYNLGVVDNKQSGSNKASNIEKSEIGVNEQNLRKVLTVILGIVFVIAFFWLLNFLIKKVSK